MRKLVIFLFLTMIVIPAFPHASAKRTAESAYERLFPEIADCILPLSTAADKHYGGNLVWGVYHKPTRLNPLFTTHSVSMSLLELIFNRLVRWNAQGQIGPDLAASWDISGDGLIYTFYLRKGVQFHDGVECTASDVKFTYDTLTDPDVGSPFRQSLQLIKECRVLDTYTVQLVLKKPSASFIQRLRREIVPRHLLEHIDLAKCSFNFHPVGTGPFCFKQWTKDNTMILDYNPDYYEGRPYLDNIIVKTHTSSQDVWTALMRKEVDFVFSIEQTDYEIVKNDPAFKSYAFALDYYYALVYNPHDPILADKRIRQAIAQGINQRELIDTIAAGYGLKCSGPFYPGSLGFNPQVKAISYNPQKAMQLLARAGWYDGNEDGILARAGKELKINVLVDKRSSVQKRLAMFIRQQLQEIGIKTRVHFYDDEAMLTDEFLNRNNIQAHLRLFFAGVDPDQSREDWCSTVLPRFDKLWVYQNQEVDRLFQRGEVNNNRSKRQLIYQQLHQIIYEDQPACFLYFPFGFHVVSARFEDTDNFFNLDMPYYLMKDWYLKQ